MSFLAKLFIDDQEFNLLDCEYSFIQNTDLNGKPSAKPKGGKLNLSIESSGSHDFFDWMITPTAIKSGKVVFYRRESEAKMKELVFNDAYCIYFKEVFNSTGEDPMTISLELSAKELRMGQTNYENAWSL